MKMTQNYDFIDFEKFTYVTDLLHKDYTFVNL